MKDDIIFSNIEDLYKKLSDLKAKKGTLWFGISGSWRKTNEEVEKNVRLAVRQIIQNGDGIVSGGALNVDYFATDEALKLNLSTDRIKIFLPVTLDLYSAHYRRRAVEGVITPEQAEILIKQLELIKNTNPSSLIENKTNTIVDTTTYYERNTEVVNASDSLLVFQVNDSAGTGDTMDKAINQHKPVCVQKFYID